MHTRRQDCWIDREDPAFPASAVLRDEEGELLWRFDEDWTEEHIWAALEFANKLYGLGCKAGEAAHLQRLVEAVRTLRAMGIVAIAQEPTR